MKILLKNANLFTPTKLGVKDVLIENGKVTKISKTSDKG